MMWLRKRTPALISVSPSPDILKAIEANRCAAEALIAELPALVKKLRAEDRKGQARHG